MHNSLGGGGREIITLQFGGFANYTGAHFWNAQSEQVQRAASDARIEAEDDVALPLDPRILFKLGARRTTPRAVLVEYSTALGLLHPLAPGIGTGAATVDENLWDGAVEKHVAPQHPKSQFLRWLEQGVPSVEEHTTVRQGKSLVGEGDSGGAGREEEEDENVPPDVESGVKVWSDFSKVYYHERTVQTVHRYGSQEGFDVFPYGAEVLEDEKKLEDIMDAIRYFMEECDRLQGFHCITDVNTGFAGIADAVLQELQDEVSGAQLFGFGLSRAEPGQSAAKSGVQALNKAVATSRFSAHCSLYVPLEFESFRASSYTPNYKPKSIFHTSAIAATYLDVLSSPYRRGQWTSGLRSSSGEADPIRSIHDIVRIVQKRPGMKVASGSLVLPFIEADDPTSVAWNALCEEAYNLETPAFFGGLVSCRNHATSSQSIKAAEDAWMRQRPDGGAAQVVRTYADVPIPLTFPAIFSNKLDAKGAVLQEGVVAQHAPLDVQALASVETSKTLTLNALHRYYSNFQRRTVRATHPFTKGSGALSQDELGDIEESLEQLVQAYLT